MDTVLLVDDDNLLRYALRLKLEKQGYVVLEATCGQRAMQIVQHHPVSLILLDMGLPDGDGLDFLQALRAATDVPIIIISGEHNTGKKIRCLDCGADDYLTKPVEDEELSARIRQNLSRYRNIVGRAPGHRGIGTANGVVHIGKWRLDHERFDIFDGDDRPGNLTLPEFQLLDLLSRQAGKVLRREELCRAVCIDNYVPTPRAIDIKITRLRKKIGDQGRPPHIIRTVRGIGYMLDKSLLVTPPVAGATVLTLLPKAAGGEEQGKKGW